jgi:hypothetical protein
VDVAFAVGAAPEAGAADMVGGRAIEEGFVRSLGGADAGVREFR